ncbi:MAG: diaminopimelate decarboxylase [Firmicutes bacterium]|nr:diaminopimelate decarboxylase [Bacillota bacterium]
MGNNMMFHGCDVSALAEKYGTPLYLVSEDAIRERFAEIRESLTEKYENTRAAYASKAFQTLEMMRIVKSEGMSLDVVSGGEIYAAMKAGVDPAVMVFHGNSKTDREIIEGLEAGVGVFVVDNDSELERLNEYAAERGKVQSILLRVTPGVDSHTHSYISTGQLDSKFGFSPEKTEQVIAKADSLPGIDMKGIHFHIGSQLMENDSHIMGLEIILELLRELKAKHGWTARELNCGGGFGVHYAGDPDRVKLADFMDPMMEKITAFYQEQGDPRPLITIEPGRWVVAEAGITVYEVGAVKKNAAGRIYAGIDGGFPDNPRTELYNAAYEVEAVEKTGELHDVKTTIAGKCCESGDIIAYDVMLPALERGDHIAIFATGAYNYTMSSNYNKLGRPPVVMIRNGKDRLTVKRETYEDMIRNEL